MIGHRLSGIFRQAMFVLEQPGNDYFQQLTLIKRAGKFHSNIVRLKEVIRLVTIKDKVISIQPLCIQA